ncbi:SRPBCC family protein [Nannocystaceae bacterium ST9]
MRVHNEESILVAGPVEAVFDHACDAAKLCALLTGWGPVPATTRIELLDGATTPAVGVRRRVQTSDGGELEEEVLAFDRPRRHTYRLYGAFKGPAKLLVREGRGDWRFEAVGERETRVHWRYEFELRSALAWPLAIPMIKVAFAGMQRSGLRGLAAAFAGGR